MEEEVISGQLVDLHRRSIYPAEVRIAAGHIVSIRQTVSAEPRFILPGFVDAHVHVESSMLPPTEFARMAVLHGTVGTVSDPHEIANVLGLAGVEFMIENARQTPFKFCFGASPCVPATGFETAGAHLGIAEVATLLNRPEIGYLSEVMNYPGVLAGDPDLLAKIAAAKAVGKPIDGHAPGLRGDEARRYSAAGIETDHECYTLAEALDKIACGMLISIREGSAAKNFAALEPLLKTHPQSCMLCTDDLHPDSLVRGHLDRLVARAIAGGADLFDVLQAACLRPVEHYRMPIGTLREGDPADFIVVDDLSEFGVVETWIDGKCVARNGESFLPLVAVEPLNYFVASSISPEDLEIAAAGPSVSVKVIEAYDGELITGSLRQTLQVENGLVMPTVELDILKIVVVNRYRESAPAVGLIRGFGLKRGAIASSVAHDSHNVVAVGVTDVEISLAVNAVIEKRGGVCAASLEEVRILPLPIAGLMSTAPGFEVARHYELVADLAREFGSPLGDAFMTLSFMALLVIPDLKMSDLGLFSGTKFEFAPLLQA